MFMITQTKTIFKHKKSSISRIICPNVLKRHCITPPKSVKRLPYFIAIPTGMVAGFVSALTGVGGGLVMIPVLSHFTRFSQQRINATSLFSVTLGCAVGSKSYMDSGLCNLPIAFTISVASVISTGLGVRLAQRLRSERLREILSFAMIFSIPSILNKESLKSSDESIHKDHSIQKRMNGQLRDFITTSNISFLREDFEIPCIESLRINPSVKCNITTGIKFSIATLPYIFIGSLSGFLSGLLGIGGGLIMTTGLTSITNLSQLEVIGTSLLSAVPIGLSASYHNLRSGNVSVRTSLILGSSLSVSVWFTSLYLTSTISDENLRNFFSGFLAISAITMFVRR